MGKFIMNGVPYGEGTQIYNNTYGAFIDTNRVIKTTTTFNSDTSYTATEDCAIVYSIAVNTGTNGQIFVDGEPISAFYSGDGIMQPTDLLYLKTGQTVLFKPTYSPGVSSYTVYGLTFGTNNIFTPQIYSLTEREVGTWIDGKPLYQRTFDLTSTTLSDNAWNSNVLGTQGTNIIIHKLDGFFASDGRIVFPYSWYRSSSNYFTWTLNDTRDDIEIRPNANISGQTISPGIVTIQYTKTTDTPGSAQYNTLGVPTHHYDDTEKIVGTWFGETLYEKSYTNFSGLTGQARTLDLGLSGIENIWYVSEGCIISNGLYPFPYVHYDSSNTIGGFWDMNNGSPQFCFRTGSQSTDAVINVFTVRYTKLTT